MIFIIDRCTTTSWSWSGRCSGSTGTWRAPPIHYSTSTRSASAARSTPSPPCTTSSTGWVDLGDLDSIHTWDLLGVNYCLDYSLNNGLYCTKQAHSHLLFAQLLCGLKSWIMEFFLNGAELSLNSVNSEKLINHWSMNWAQFKDPIVDTVEGVCNGFKHYTRFLGFLEFPGYHQWQQESQ